MRDSCPRTCAKEITQQVRDYAAAQGVKDDEALAEGMAEKSEEFREAGGEIYGPA